MIPTSQTVRTSAASATDLHKSYGEGRARVAALDGVTVDFEARRLTAIMGPSGSGKSTLMHCLAGLDRPTSGGVRIGDTDITSLTDTELTLVRREQVGFVFQAFNLLPTLTAGQNILLPLKLSRTKPDPEWTDLVLRTLGLQDRLDHRPHELSGGQQQRVAVARALVMRPRVIFADEPTGALDSVRGAQLLDFLQRSVHELGQSVVMVTHDPVAASYADRVVLLADGRLSGEIAHPSVDSVLAALRGLGV
ncbi:ABC transporter ATP-binding protein [Luteipulveratus halotolerans]|uniref:ABC transporter domain-containing protein n=1 Tax=Luteipulveratus halotolerans TaxID=1631356 RepID=A0A0L6CLR5_9MICO|nr:ABC transporter ATP-binding protein [Luteipulveratus halotolerans]KNX38453.1 hypothetical protein VV01_16980 [Luteipulveratus halotolerans]